MSKPPPVSTPERSSRPATPDEESPSSEPTATTRRSALSGLFARADAYALLVLTVVTAVAFSVAPATSAVFPTAANFQAIGGSQSILILATIGVLLPLICGEFDLSVGANLGLAAILSAKVMASGGPLWLAIVVAVLSGTTVGAVNGLLVTRAKVDAVVMTLATTVAIGGLVQWVTNGATISNGISSTLLNIGSGLTLGVPTILLVTLAIAGIVGYVLAYTPLGRQFYLMGDNRSAARLVGLNVDRLVVTGFVIGGAAAGLGGLLLVAQSGSATPSGGIPYLLPAYAAAFLGASAIRPGKYNVMGSITAIAFLAVVNGGINLAGLPSYLSDFVNAIALIFGVAVAGYLTRRKQGAAAGYRSKRIERKRAAATATSP
jgi:ribose transport system permease protein